MKYVGIDIGGMTIKGGIVDEKGNILLKKVVVTSPGKEDYLIVQDIANLIEDLTKDCKDEIEGIGIGCPGSIYDEKGVVRYSCNINFRNTPMAKMIAEKTQIKNDRIMYWTLELASKLEDAPWPATREELIDYAMRSGAPLEVIENLQEMEDEGEVYECIEDIWPC